MFGLASIFRLFGSTDNDPTIGTGTSVASAISAALGDLDVTYATLGEPELREYGGQFNTDLKVVVPVTSDRYDNPAPLTFDLPDALDDEASDLLAFLGSLGIDPESHDYFGVFEIEGTQIPVTRENGRIEPLWEEYEVSA